ncbi:lipase [Paracoccus sp. (in: a-proteobacteria)]|uniref:SGNH/GDSL hydrolase family protein n=1 Tax=Paracoccus sp. TaxID=267 RepID=UPI00321F73C0
MGLAGFAVWPVPPHPVTPVPDLSQPADSGFHAELLAPQHGLTPLPARVTGRVAAGPEGSNLRHEWPGLHALARFQGRAVTLRLDDPVNRWRITLDGHAVEISRPGRRDLRLDGLTDGPHEIRAEKLSESPGPALFGGFFLDPGARPLAPPPARALIEFIGDSDTLGLADTALRRDCSSEQVYAATDTSQGYAPRVAQALGADYRMIARSGTRLLPNYGHPTPVRTMEILYPLALPSDPETPALPEARADLLVIALGSNVFGTELADQDRLRGKGELRRDFGLALTDFAARRARENPGATVVLLAFGEYGADLVASHQAAAEALTRQGIANRLIVLGKPGRHACLWHPTLQDHRMIAEATLAGLQGVFPPPAD